MSRKRVERNIAYDTERDRYYVTFHGTANRFGTMQRHTKTFRTYEDAVRALRCFETSRLPLPMTPTLEDWLCFWLFNVVEPNRSASTVHGYRNIIYRHLIPALGDVRLDHLTPVALQYYYGDKLREDLSPNTVRKHHHLLLAALELAVRQGILERSPARSVLPPAPVAPRHTYYNSIQLHRLFELTEGTPLELVVKLAGFLGLRRSEICGLQWNRVDLQNNILEINHIRTAVGGDIVEKGTKTPASHRKLDFSDLPELQIPLAREQNRQISHGALYNPGGYVIVRPDGVPYQPDYLSTCLSRFVRIHNLPAITLHGLRHSFASIANSSHIPMFDIGKAMGHSSPAVTSRIYTHLFDLTHRSAICAVGSAVRIENFQDLQRMERENAILQTC